MQQSEPSIATAVLDREGRIVILAKAYTTNRKNAVRQPRVSLAVPDWQAHPVVCGDAEPIEANPSGNLIELHEPPITPGV